MTTKEKIAQLLREVPPSRDDDIVLGNNYYWRYHKEYCMEKDNKMLIDTSVYYITKRETIERIKREIQSEAREKVKNGERKYSVYLGKSDNAKLDKEQRVRQAARQGSIENAL